MPTNVFREVHMIPKRKFMFGPEHYQRTDFKGGGEMGLGFTYTGCPGGNVPDFGRMFLTLKYTDLTQNTYIRG